MPKSMSTHQVNPYSKIYPPEVVRAMEHILAIPSGPKRWRASVAVWLNQDQKQESGLTAKQEYLHVVGLVREINSNLKNKFAELTPGRAGTVGGGSGVRHSLEMPAGAWGYIKMFDKLAFDPDNPDAGRNMAKAVKEFQEFKVAEAH